MRIVGGTELENLVRGVVEYIKAGLLSTSKRACLACYGSHKKPNKVHGLGGFVSEEQKGAGQM